MRSTMRRVLRQAGVRRRHLALQLDRAMHRIDRAGELDQHAVAHDLDDAARHARAPWARGSPSAAPSAPPASPPRPASISRRVADHVGDGDRGKTALDAFFGQWGDRLRNPGCTDGIGAIREVHRVDKARVLPSAIGTRPTLARPALARCQAGAMRAAVTALPRRPSRFEGFCAPPLGFEVNYLAPPPARRGRSP